MKLIPFLKHTAYEMRRWSLLMTTNAGSGHATSSLSAADIMTVLFFYAMRYDPKNFNNSNNDRFILSKGHAAPILYATWKEVGQLTKQDLLSYRSFESVLEGHPTLRFPYTEAATGALGIGLSIGAGEALCAKLDTRSYKTFVLMGDSEVSEGSIWEAAQLATYYKLNNIIGIIDCNRLGQSTPTMEALEGDGPERFKKMFDAFGWHSEIVDGHDMQSLVTVLDEARANADRPIMIIARTKKGYGVALMEDKEGYHGKALKPDQEKIALEQLREKFADAASYSDGYQWNPKMPGVGKESKKQIIEMPLSAYKKGEEIPTRKAYGQSLVALGGVCEQVVSLDGEVKNSTYAELFEKAYPDRFYQCFIAEQNMIGMGIGFNRRGFIPFISTFASFFSRAHDQLRMAAIGQASLRLAGSHAGVSIGQDGPSQMGLEDIAMMRGLPESIVLYPCDAVSTYKLVNEMANHHESISYLRTTRMATPIIYDTNESFPVGGCKVLKQSSFDQVLVIGAGVTLFEALKAHEELAKEGTSIAVIDLYSIKPLDVKTIISVARTCKNRIITVEDHYSAGGIGEAVAAAVSTEKIEVYRLAVTHLPRSGKPDELLADAGIDAEAIVKQVHSLRS